MTDTAEVKTVIHDFLRGHFPQVRKRGVADEDKLLEMGTVDSLGILDLVHFLEAQFSIRVSDDELLTENFQSVTRIAEFIQRKMHSTGETSTPGTQGR